MSGIRRSRQFRDTKYFHPHNEAALLPTILSNVALSSECGNSVAIDLVNNLSGIVSLADLTAKFGEWCQGNGPASWYKSAKDKQIWFYWKESNQTATAAASKNNSVLLATEVNTDDQDEQKII